MSNNFPHWVYFACAWLFLAAPVQARPQRVVSLDGCADQYVLGLVPRDSIVGVSERAMLQDSWFRERARGIRRVHAEIESVMALQPDVVVRVWGGDPKLLQMLQKRNIKVININEINAYDQAESELLRVGHELGQDTGARIEAHRFKAALEDVRPIGLGRSVLYYTPSGFSAGPDTMAGDMLKRLDFHLESQNKGFYYLSPEVMLSLKPDVFALAFYDDRYAMRRVPGRNPLVQKLIAATPRLVIPTRALACSGWFTAYDLQALSMTVVK